jgi:mannose-6-phosphate isomerase-like protein (cupin superfamily)
MKKYHHRQLPSFSTLLAGTAPRNELGFCSDRLQINYFNTNKSWDDPLPHAHQESDECYLVLSGSVILEVEGERVTLGPREFCCLSSGTYHQIVEVHSPIECLIIRGPSIADKSYMHPDGMSTTDKIGVQDIFGLLNEDNKSITE